MTGITDAFDAFREDLYRVSSGCPAGRARPAGGTGRLRHRFLVRLSPRARRVDSPPFGMRAGSRPRFGVRAGLQVRRESASGRRALPGDPCRYRRSGLNSSAMGSRA